MVGALTVVLAATSLAAHAADLPARAPYSPPPVAVPVYNWTGIYLGVNGGYGWGRQDPLSLITSQYDRSILTSTGGWLAEHSAPKSSRAMWCSASKATSIGPISRARQRSFPRFSVFRPIYRKPSLTGEIRHQHCAGRVGYAVQNWLWYGTGGVAVVPGKTNVSLTGATCGTAGVLPCSGDAMRVGIAAGGGLEYGFTQNWSVKRNIYGSVQHRMTHTSAPFAAASTIASADEAKRPSQRTSLKGAER